MSGGRIHSRFVLPRPTILIPALPFCHAVLRVARPKSERYPEEIKNLGDHIRARRLDLGLLQKQVAEQIGVCPATITNWERNESQPPVHYVPAINRFLGYDPLTLPTALLPERLTAARWARGMTQKQLASTLGVDPTTIRDWERGQHEPSRKKRELIDAFLR